MTKTSLSVLFSIAAGIGAAVACAPSGDDAPPEGHYPGDCCGFGNGSTLSACCNSLAMGTCDTDPVSQSECDNATFGEQTGGPVTSGGTGGVTDSDSQTLTLGEGPEDSGGIDDSGGECVPTEATYNCHGWVAGVYLRDDTGAHGFSFNGTTNAECFGGGDSVQITVPFQGEGENDYLLDKCQEKCEMLLAEGQWSEADWSGTSQHNPAYWDYWKTVCVVHESAYNGSIPDNWEGVDDGPLPGFSEGCAWVGKSGDSVGDHIPKQVTYEGPAAEDECAPPEGCGGWDPDSLISHGVVGSTHTTQFDADLMTDIMGGDWRQLYACDSGRYQQSIVSGVEKWKMFNLSSTGNEVLYSMGFRSGDYDVKIRKSGSGQTTYTLNSYGAMALAFDALWPGTTSFVVMFKRPVGQLVASHTMNLTFI